MRCVPATERTVSPQQRAEFDLADVGHQSSAYLAAERYRRNKSLRELYIQSCTMSEEPTIPQPLPDPQPIAEPAHIQQTPTQPASQPYQGTQPVITQQGQFTGYAQNGYYPPVPPTSSKGIIALVLGLLAVMCTYGLTAIPAIIIGWMGMREPQSPYNPNNKAMATIGFILGIFGLLILIAIVIGLILFFGLGWDSESSYQFDSFSSVLGL